MIRINNIKLKVGYTDSDLDNAVRKALKLPYTPAYHIAKLSLDDRRRNQVFYIASADVETEHEDRILHKVYNNNIMSTHKPDYSFPAPGSEIMHGRPVVIGTGPAGLFAALFLARAGYMPVVYERGADVDSRIEAVRAFWNGEKPLDVNCNVQFGEGGAGTFSDGKLATGIKDVSGRRTEVLRTFVTHGAPPEILYQAKPHLGTDRLSHIVKSMRLEIERLGGEVHFNSLFVGYEAVGEENEERRRNVNLKIRIQDVTTGKVTEHMAGALVLAIGHSSRDTFTMLYKSGLSMEAKAFAMGLRIEHRRSDIDLMKYGDNPEYAEKLPAADYKLTHTAANGRAVYSFCMCPGGYVVNASSEEGRMCVNGMSYSGRNGENSNSAIVVNVTPEDFGSSHPLAGMEFQRRLEAAAQAAGDGAVPVQLFGDYKAGRRSDSLGSVTPQIKGGYRLSDLNCCLPEYINNAIIDGITAFDRRMPGFAADDAVLSGIEARTSSPVRIVRDEDMSCGELPIYPCGEGAGYAGGITSAAVDGIKTAEAIVRRYSADAH